MARLRQALQRLVQAPVLISWYFLIWLAPKTKYKGFIVCDVSGDQSVYGGKFAVDVSSALDRLSEKSPKLFGRVQHFVQRIVRAGIQNQFEYYARSQMLLLSIDYGRQGLMRREAVMTYIAQVATLAYLRERAPSLVEQDGRVQRILSKQRAFLEGKSDAGA
jgi:hypothetical protein